MINPQGAELLGKTMVEVLGSDDRALRSSGDAEQIMATDREVMGSGVPQVHELVMVVNGVDRVLITATTTWHDVERNVRGVIAIAQDVTERRRGERDGMLYAGRLRSMANALVIHEERLRRSLAADLHNGIGQDLALIKLKLSRWRESTMAEVAPTTAGDRAARSSRRTAFCAPLRS